MATKKSIEVAFTMIANHNPALRVAVLPVDEPEKYSMLPIIGWASTDSLRPTPITPIGPIELTPDPHGGMIYLLHDDNQRNKVLVGGEWVRMKEIRNAEVVVEKEPEPKQTEEPAGDDDAPKTGAAAQA